MQRADLTTRAVAGFIDLLIVLGLFERQSVGKKLIGLRVASCDTPGAPTAYRESILRNTTIAAALLLFFIPYAGWVLGPLALLAEGLVALGDDRSMRVGDMIARTMIVTAAPAGTAGPVTSREQQSDIAGSPEEAGAPQNNH
jgi:uncharacterized RDD family membrane protein YckC